MKFIKENYLFLLLIITLFLLDRFVKIEILKILENKNYLIINDYLNLDLVFNTGIGFGLLSLEKEIYYNFLSLFIFMIILVLIFVMINSQPYEKVLFSFIIGGALGNLYDRIVFKAVPDFIDLHIGDFHWFSFNLADIFITVGVIFMILTEFTAKEKK